ncbi:FAD-dependent oxidoreductase [Actinosynnema sp. NPDC020468]|uniref:NAD(P)/FAD-dependent oxidoreductase n=1 Tax=Actinosynnema sp. NPDC020468 TaxID=3154488 RepID=UPI0033D5F83B
MRVPPIDCDPRASTGERSARARVPRGRPGSAVLVGGGVVNLVTALKLVDHGFTVELFDRAPDPRLDRPWHEYGCTRGGGNARMFTVTEADQYSGMVLPDGEGTVFDAPPTGFGWDVRRESVRSVHDREWIREYEDLPWWLADRYETGIHDLNRSAEQGWERLFEAHPVLAGGTHLRRGILRVYSTAESHQRAVSRHDWVGDRLETYTEAEVRDRFPMFAHAGKGRLAGGIKVRGFTLDIHRFVALALDVLQARGAGLHFDSEVTGVDLGGGGTIEGVRIGSESVSARHLVISPGAYGNRLLAELGLGGRVAGVLGIWHTLPDLTGQQHSVKVSRPGRIAEDANITLGTAGGRPSLVVGSGYGFAGTSADNVDPDRVRVIQRSVDEMMRTLLPDAYEAAGGPAWLAHDPVFCVRPWTTTGLGVFDVRATATGRCVVTGGHNTGGFAQAPEVADAVLASLLGEDHPMHHLYAVARSRGSGHPSLR